jgi:predicted TIM-barrel fold metal-dependent hydrolase
LGLHVELLARGCDLSKLLPLIEASGVRLVIDHFADPDPTLGAESPGFLAALRAIENGRTFIKLSATNRIAPAISRACARRLLESAGTERLLWGSDAPFIGHEATARYADTLQLFESIVPDPRQRHEISLTALRNFFF